MRPSTARGPMWCGVRVVDCSSICTDMPTTSHGSNSAICSARRSCVCRTPSSQPAACSVSEQHRTTRHRRARRTLGWRAAARPVQSGRAARGARRTGRAVAAAPAPLVGEDYFSGGYNTDRHGSRRGALRGRHPDRVPLHRACVIRPRVARVSPASSPTRCSCCCAIATAGRRDRHGRRSSLAGTRARTRARPPTPVKCRSARWWCATGARSRARRIAWCAMRTPRRTPKCWRCARRARARGDARLGECTLYITLEPCAMCAGAIVLARIGRVVFSAWDDKAGMAGSVGDLLRHPKLNHRPHVLGGVDAGDRRAHCCAHSSPTRAPPTDARAARRRPHSWRRRQDTPT
jgi:hypothetical protein